MTIGERIKNRRTELGLSVDDVAKRLGKNRATVYRYENGFIEDMPSSVLESLAHVLATTPADLLGWNPPETPQTVNYTLTDVEAEIIRKYRALDASDRARIEERIDEMLEKKTKRMEGDINVG